MRPRRFVSLMVAGCMMVSMMPVSAVTAFAAEETRTSEVAEELTPYQKLMGEIQNAKKGDTIKLEENITGGVTIPEGADITLDLNGKSISNSANWAILNNGTLKITGNGEITSTANYSICVGNGSMTTIESGTIVGQEGAVAIGKSTGATVIINDGIFEGKDNAVVAGNGSRREGAPNKITINGGTFNGGIITPTYVACGIYAPWQDEITVNGGTFNITGGAGIVARAGNVTVTGGEFHVSGNTTGRVGDSRIVVPCAALVYDSEASYPAMTDRSNITISGGTFTSDPGVASVAVVKAASDTNDRIAISGGTFSSDPTAFCVAGKEGAQDGNNYIVKEKSSSTGISVKVDENPDNEERDDTLAGVVEKPVELEVAVKGNDVSEIETMSLDFGNDIDKVKGVSITKGAGYPSVPLDEFKAQSYKNMPVSRLNALLDSSVEETEENEEENGIALYAVDNAPALDADIKTIDYNLRVTYTEEGVYPVTVEFKNQDEKVVKEKTASIVIGQKLVDTGDAAGDGSGAGAVIAGVAIGVGVAAVAYHAGVRIYADQVLGSGVAVPRTREEVALKAWELAGKPAVAAEGEPLSETAQAERWVVESGLMQNEVDGSFNGQKKMGSLNALRTLDAAKKLG